MSVGQIGKLRRTLRRAGVRLAQSFAWALVMALAVAATAAEQRAIKLRVSPVYPEIAKRLRVTGVVRLEVTVDADGKVTDVKTVSGNHMLSMAAEEAVHRWKFAPGSSESTEDLDINFELGQ
jgi:TonB family protein